MMGDNDRKDDEGSMSRARQAAGGRWRSRPPHWPPIWNS